MAALGLWRAGFAVLSVCRVQGRGTRPAPRPRQIGRKLEVAPPAPDRAHGLYPAAEVAAAVHKSRYH